jgi:hypothetical protein
MNDNEQNLLAMYRELHDWLSELVEDAYRRVSYATDENVAVPTEGLVERLTELARLDRR